MARPKKVVREEPKKVVPVVPTGFDPSFPESKQRYLRQ